MDENIAGEDGDPNDRDDQHEQGRVEDATQKDAEEARDQQQDDPKEEVITQARSGGTCASMRS